MKGKIKLNILQNEYKKKSCNVQVLMKNHPFYRSASITDYANSCVAEEQIRWVFEDN